MSTAIAGHLSKKWVVNSTMAPFFEGEKIQAHESLRTIFSISNGDVIATSMLQGIEAGRLTNSDHSSDQIDDYSSDPAVDFVLCEANKTNIDPVTGFTTEHLVPGILIYHKHSASIKLYEIVSNNDPTEGKESDGEIEPSNDNDKNLTISFEPIKYRGAHRQFTMPKDDRGRPKTVSCMGVKDQNLLIGCNDGALYTFDVWRREGPTRSFRIDQFLNAATHGPSVITVIKIDPNVGRNLAYIGDNRGNIAVFDFTKVGNTAGRVVATCYDHNQRVNDISILKSKSADTPGYTGMFVSCSTDEMVNVWQISSEVERKIVQTPSSPTAINVMSQFKSMTEGVSVCLIGANALADSEWSHHQSSPWHQEGHSPPKRPGFAIVVSSRGYPFDIWAPTPSPKKGIEWNLIARHSLMGEHCLDQLPDDFDFTGEPAVTWLHRWSTIDDETSQGRALEGIFAAYNTGHLVQTTVKPEFMIKRIYSGNPRDISVVRLFNVNPAHRKSTSDSLKKRKTDGGLPETVEHNEPRIVGLAIAETASSFRCLSFVQSEASTPVQNDNDDDVYSAENRLDLKACQIYGAQSISPSGSEIGHTNDILSLDVSSDGCWILTAAKDNTCRIWCQRTGKCVAVFEGHQHSVYNAIFNKKGVKGVECTCCINSRTSQKSKKRSADDTSPLPTIPGGGGLFFLSTSEDGSMKLWTCDRSEYVDNMNNGIKDPVHIMESTASVQAHKKRVNDIAIAPNDKLCATASNDKTVQVFSLPNLTKVGTLRGFKGHVTSVCFHPKEKQIISGDAFGNIKIHSADTFELIRDLQGPTTAVTSLRVLEPFGLQTMAGTADGKIYMHNLLNGSYEQFANHYDRIWSLDLLNHDVQLDVDGNQKTKMRVTKTMVSGGSDARVLVWSDVTEEEKRKEIEIEQKRLNELTKIDEFIKMGDLVKATIICLTYNRIVQMRAILENYRVDLSAVINELDANQRKTLIQFIQKWHSNAKTCHLATLLFKSLLDTLSDEELTKIDGFKSFCDMYSAYSDRHYSRLSTLKSKSYLLDVILDSSGLSSDLSVKF